MPEKALPDRKKQEKADQNKHVSTVNSQSKSQNLMAWDIPPSVTETPFYPLIQRHITLLSGASPEQRFVITRQLQQTYGNKYVERLVNSIPSHGNSKIKIQRSWKAQDVDEILNKDKMGQSAIKDINNQGYTVLHINQYKFKRQIYTDETYRHKVGKPIEKERRGWIEGPNKILAISDKLDNGNTASTFVHETTHANQLKANKDWLIADKEEDQKPYPNVESMELEAHIEQAKFNKAQGIPQKSPDFLDKNGEIDEKAIKKYVKETYAIGPNKQELPHRDTKAKYKVIEKFKPWPKEI